MRWTRLLSRIWGTGTSTTCVRMRSDTRSRVITLTLSSVCFSEFSCGISWISCGTSCGIDVSVVVGWVLNVLVSGAPPYLHVAKLRRCFVDLRFQRTGSSTMQVFESCWRPPVACEDLGLPTASRLCGAGVPWVLTGTHSVQSHPR